MKKWFVFMLVLFSLFTTPLFIPVQADDHYATCDLCGFCIPNQNKSTWPTPPSNWKDCQKCLYGFGDIEANSGQTLKLDDSTNQPPASRPGHAFTMIGCLSTNLSDFTQAGAAASVIKTLLSYIFGITGALAFMYLIYGSFIIITSQAEPERLAYGKRTVMGAIIGVIFSMSSIFLVNLIANGVLRIPGFGGQ